MMVNEDAKEFSFGNLLNHSILQNQRHIFALDGKA